MRRVTLLVSTVLAMFAFDVALFRRREDSHASTTYSLSAEEELRQRRVIQQQRLGNVIPPWVKRARAPVRMKVNHFKNRTLDPRYSDQRKIRRRINNL